MNNDYETIILKAHIPLGNYFFVDKIEAYPCVGEEEYSVKSSMIPAKDIFLLLDLWSNHASGGIVFKILWNCNQYIIGFNKKFMKDNMFMLKENDIMDVETFW